MNLFVLDEDPVLAARYLDDKRLGSALMEATMMLSVAVQGRGLVGPGLLCRPSHAAHPVTLWVGATVANWRWCLAYGNAVWEEIHFRWGNWHQAGYRLGYIAKFESCLCAGPLLPFQNSARHGGFGIDFTYLPVPESYRQYLVERWKTDKRVPKYTNREFPEWLKK